jgi:hypothetical protein
MNPFPRLVLAALIQTSLLAQAAPAEPAKPAKAAPVVVDPSLCTRIFVIKHRSAELLARVLNPLTSYRAGSSCVYETRGGFNIISVRDTPESIAAMEEALKRLDVPTEPKRNVEVTANLVFASKQAQQNVQPTPEDLKPVLATLRRTLSYSNYAPAGTFQFRTTEDEARNEGQIEDPSTGTMFPMEFRLKTTHVPSTKEDPLGIGLELNCYSVVNRDDQRVAIRTNLSMKDGETVVVGTTSFKNRALILVLTAKVLD